MTTTDKELSIEDRIWEIAENGQHLTAADLLARLRELGVDFANIVVRHNECLTTLEWTYADDGGFVFVAIGLMLE
jgi:hypothetical protein